MTVCRGRTYPAPASERQAHRELELAGIERRSERKRFRDRPSPADQQAREILDGQISDDAVHSFEVRAVENIEKLRSRLEAHALRQSERPRQPNVQAEEAGPHADISAQPPGTVRVRVAITDCVEARVEVERSTGPCQQDSGKREISNEISGESMSPACVPRRLRYGVGDESMLAVEM